jgi:glycosyltransferase involved in cell wall biosynthesis
MHILFLSHSFPSAYNPMAGIFFKDQAEAMAVRTSKVGVLAVVPISLRVVFKKSSSFLGLKKSNNNSVSTWVYTYPNIPKIPTYSVYRARKTGMRLFNEYVKENGKPDVIHVQRYEAGMLAIDILTKYGIPYVVSEHSSRFTENTISPSMERIAKQVFQNAQFLSAVSPAFTAHLSTRFALSFHTIPNSVDTSLFCPASQASEKNSFVFFNAANLNANKNHALLLTSFAAFLETYPNQAILRIAGAGHKYASLLELVMRLGIEKNVFFLGQLDRDQIIQEIQQANVFLLSSQVETFGVVVIEALSVGCPVIATRCGGPESIITSEVGVLTNKNADEFSSAMKEVYENYSRFDSKSIRKFAVDRYSKQVIMEKWMAIYTSIQK